MKSKAIKRVMASMLALTIARAALPAGSGNTVLFDSPALKAEAAQTVSTTLDFGATHTEYAQYYADKAGYTVDGSKVTATVAADNIWALYDALYAIAAEGKMHVIDEGEYLSNVGLKPIDEYESKEEYDAEWQNGHEQTPADGQTYYVQWLKPLDTTYNIVFTQPLCGTEVTTKNYGSIATDYSDPAPEYTVNGVPSPDDQGVWYSAYDTENQTLSSKVDGQIMGGTSYYTRLGLDRPFKYYFPDDFGADALTVANCEIKAVITEPLRASVIAEVTAEHNDYGYSVVSLEPTAAAAGLRTYYCDCGAQLRTEEIPAGIYQVNIADSISNGSISADKESTFMTDTVTVDAFPDSGYRVERLYYVSDGTEVDITQNTDGKYTFEMPEHDVTVYAAFDQKNSVFLEFGEGHENAAALLSSVEGCTVTGTTVKYYIADKDDATYEDARAKFNELFYVLLDGYTDNHQLFYGIALHPISEYTSNSDLDIEQYLTSSDLIGDSVTFYVLWADPISELTITAPPYKCGKQLTTRSQSSTTRFVPCEVGLSDGLQLLDYYLLYTNWEISGNNDTVLQGGNTYTIHGYISTPWAKYIPADADINVIGGTLINFNPNNSNQFHISVSIPHDMGKDGICTVCGELVKCISGASITLADDLALNFYVNGITDENVDQYTVKIEGECLENGQMVALEKNESTGQYYAAAHVTARNTGEKITATLYQGDEVIDTAEPYSVTDYLESAPEKLGLDITQMSDWTTQQQNTYAMIAATQLFCDAASDYFNNTSQFEASYEAYAQASGKTEAKIDAALAAQAANYSFESDNNVFIALSLKNKTRIYIYEGDEIKYTIENLLPQQLTLEQTAGEYKFYGLSWADRVFDKQAAGTEVSQKNLNMAKAVTAYALAAAAYAG